MEKLRFYLMNLNTDRQEINLWHKRFSGTDGWNAIFDFVLEKGLICSLEELIETNYLIMPKRENQRKLALTVKNEQNEIVCFVICKEYDINAFRPRLYIQYVVVRPDNQRDGIGYRVCSELADQVAKITGVRPAFAHALVKRDNVGSFELFKKLGFICCGCYKDYYSMAGPFNTQTKKNVLRDGFALNDGERLLGNGKNSKNKINQNTL